MFTRKRIVRLVLGIVIVLAVIGLAGLAVLRSRAFHRFVLAQIVGRASVATGARVEVGDFAFHLSGLRADVYRVVVHGTEGSGRAPLFLLDRGSVGITILSVWRRRISLDDVTLD